MTVRELADQLALTALVLPAPDRAVTGGFAGDMPSWVMGRAEQGDAWLTIMNNRNIVAVAVMIDLSCVIVCDGSEVPEDVLTLAENQEVNLLKTDDSVFALSARLAALL